MVKKKSLKNSSSQETKTSIKKSNQINPWMIATFVAVLLLLILGFNTMTGKAVTCEGEVSKEIAGENLIKFAKAQGAEASLISIEEEGTLYEATISLEGQNVPIYVTKDGKNMVAQLIPFETTPATQNTQTQQAPSQTSFSEDELAEIADFMVCLAESNVKVYGANWCGYTKQLVDNLGGFEIIKPIYVECTEEDELCASEGITGYPTIKINGEQVNIARTLEGFAEATGCSAPNIGVQAAANAEVTC